MPAAKAKQQHLDEGESIVRSQKEAAEQELMRKLQAEKDNE